MSADQGLAWYILFNSHEQGLRLFSLLREAEFSATIVPTPRKLSKACGIALLINESEVEEIRALIARTDSDILKIASLARDINPNRDRYC